MGVGNLGYFVPRFPEYNAEFLAKVKAKFGVPAPARWWMVASISDGRKLQIVRDKLHNFSGHKWFYCLSFLIVTSMDGMILYCSKAVLGGESDTGLQGKTRISQHLTQGQQQAVPPVVASLFDTMTDKGFARNPAVVPMHNNYQHFTLKDGELRGAQHAHHERMGRGVAVIGLQKKPVELLHPLGLYFRVT